MNPEKPLRCTPQRLLGFCSSLTISRNPREVAPTTHTMQAKQLWSEMDQDERNLRLGAIQRRATGAFAGVMLSTLFWLGLLPALVLAGVTACICHMVLHRRATRSLLAAHGG